MDFSKLDAKLLERYTPAETELAWICKGYRIGELLTVDGELGGLFNVNIRMTTSTGQYVCRINSGLSHKNHLDAQEQLLSRLRENNVPVLVPLQTKQGDHYLILRNRFVQVTPFVSGIEFQYSQQHAFELGRTLRRFHDACVDEYEFPPPCWSNYPSNEILQGGIKLLREQQQQGLHDAVLIEVVEKLHQMVMEQWMPRAKECVTTVIHGDWHVWNVIFDESGKVEYILDFDSLQKGERIHDLAYFMWSIRNRPDHEMIGRDFMHGYGTISPTEKELLPTAIARASVFFLCTASFTANPGEELMEQVKAQKPYIQWLLSSDGQRSVRSQVSN